MVNTDILKKYGIGGMSSFLRDKRREKAEREEIARKATEVYQNTICADVWRAECGVSDHRKWDENGKEIEI